MYVPRMEYWACLTGFSGTPSSKLIQLDSPSGTQRGIISMYLVIRHLHDNHMAKKEKRRNVFLSVTHTLPAGENVLHNPANMSWTMCLCAKVRRELGFCFSPSPAGYSAE